jgi:hypothetical protein
VGATLVTAVLGVGVPRSAAAGAWAQEDKGLYLKISGAHSRAGKQYKENGETFPLLSANESGTYRSSAVRLYGAFGLLPDLTYIASTSIVSSVVESSLVRIRTTGLADFSTGLKYQFLDKPFVASVSSLVTVPTGYTAEPTNVKTPTLGLGVPMYEANLLFGKSFYPAPIYASAEVGIRLRGSRASASGNTVDYPPEMPFVAEVGVHATDWLLARAMLFGIHGFGDPGDLNLFSLSPTTQRYMKLGPSVIVTLREQLQLNFDYLYTLTGVNAVKSHDFAAGVALDYKF